MAILDSLRGAALGAIDAINIWTDPFEVRDGPADTVDRTPLADKAKIAWGDIQANWLYGPNREFYWHMSRNDLGDMCIWHGFYTATCAYMRDLVALNRALDGMEKLLYLGGDARLCRGAGELGGPHAIDPSRKYYQDSGYVFIGDCSESSLIGFLFGLWAVRRCMPPDSTYVARADLMAVDLARQLMADGMRMLNNDGSPAKFGDLRPGLFTAPIRLSAGACAILMAEAAGNAGYTMPSYAKIYRYHRGALTHPETHFMFVHPWYQDVLAYAVLLMQASILPQHQASSFRRAMAVMWAKTRKEDNPLYAAMAAEAQVRPSYEEQVRCRRTLEECNVTSRELPSPKLPGTVSYQDQDSFDWGVWKWRRRRARRQIPAWRRPPADFLWQRCPYSLEGGESWSFNWMDYCLAWAMGHRARMW